VFNPEFRCEGTGVHDSLEPGQLLVGADDAEGFDAMRHLYAPLLEARR
jgi:UDP-glucose 6-dehydrogenase